MRVELRATVKLGPDHWEGPGATVEVTYEQGRALIGAALAIERPEPAQARPQLQQDVAPLEEEEPKPKPSKPRRRAPRRADQ